MRSHPKALEAAWWLGSLAVAVGLIWLWQLAADARFIPAAFFPGPDRAWVALKRWFDSGLMTEALGNTLRRMVLGWMLASVLGIVLGCLIGTSYWVRTLVNPTLEFLRPLPASAVVPVAILVLGLSEQMVLATIAFGAVWPVLLATIHGVTTTEPRLLDVARALNLSRLQTMFKIVLPCAMPSILTSLRLTLTIALILTIIGEKLASRRGLGEFIFVSAHSFMAPEVFAGTIVLACIELIINLGLQMLERRLLAGR